MWFSGVDVFCQGEIVVYYESMKRNLKIKPVEKSRRTHRITPSEPIWENEVFFPFSVFRRHGPAHMEILALHSPTKKNEKPIWDPGTTAQPMCKSCCRGIHRHIKYIKKPIWDPGTTVQPMCKSCCRGLHRHIKYIMDCGVLSQTAHGI